MLSNGGLKGQSIMEKNIFYPLFSTEIDNVTKLLQLVLITTKRDLSDDIIRYFGDSKITFKVKETWMQ